MAAVTVARVAPKNTLLFEASASKPAPIIVIGVPTSPAIGKNELIIGAGLKVKPPARTVPPWLTTTNSPVSPSGTTAVTILSATKAKVVAALPPKLTEVVPVRLAPFITTVSPLAANFGSNKEIVGGKKNTKPSLKAVPLEFETDTLPLVPAPTMAVMVVEETTVKEVASVFPKKTASTPVK